MPSCGSGEVAPISLPVAKLPKRAVWGVEAARLKIIIKWRCTGSVSVSVSLCLSPVWLCACVPLCLCVSGIIVCPCNTIMGEVTVNRMNKV